MKRISIIMIALMICGFCFANEGDNTTFELRYNDDPAASLISGEDFAQRVEHMIVDDCDGDGKPEIILTPRLGGGTPQGTRIEIYEATDDNTYEMIFAFDGSDGVFYRSSVLGCADLDGNGKKEILIGVNSVSKDVLGVLENTGDNTWETTPHLYTWADMGGDTSVEPDFTSTIVGGDLDDDGQDEVAFCTTNPTDNIMIASVASGTFAGDNIVWNKEYERLWETVDDDKGSPYAMVWGNIDNDANNDIAVICWDNLRCDIYESTAADTYVLASSNELSDSDDYSWYGARIADVDGNGIGELWIMNISSGDVLAAEIADVSAVTAGDFNTVFDLDYFGGTGNGQINIAFGDQDHGVESDGMDLYLVGGSDNTVFDLEYKGSGDIMDSANWTKYLISPGTADDTLWMVEAPATDLDGDTNAEIVFTRQDADGAEDLPTLYIYEWYNVIVLNANGVWNLYE